MSNKLKSLMAVLILALLISALIAVPLEASSKVPAKGMVTLIDLGAHKCIPCKMMAHILAELKKEYKGQADVIFLDVWEDRSLASQYGIRVIPTQIFYDKHGTEFMRHEGFLSKEQIELVFKKLGVEKTAQ
jgi:thioredoxin